VPKASGDQRVSHPIARPTTSTFRRMVSLPESTRRNPGDSPASAVIYILIYFKIPTNLKIYIFQPLL
jgi:hypothetical protein